MPYNFGPLARNAGGHKLLNITGQVWPEKPILNQHCGGFDTRVSEVVEVGDDTAAESGRDKGARRRLGHFTDEELGRIREADKTKPKFITGIQVEKL